MTLSLTYEFKCLYLLAVNQFNQLERMNMRTIITPLDANNILLNHNNSNRPLNKRAVKFISDQITSGQWVYNGQPIIIGQDGALLDGQHRLAACVKSNINIDAELISNVPNDTFSTMDSGRTRTAADCFAISGTSNSNFLSAVLRQYVQYSNMDSFAFPRVISLSNDKVPSSVLLEAHDYINSTFLGDENFSNLNEFIAYYIAQTKKHTGLRISCYAFAALMTYILNKDDSLSFLSKMIDGLFSDKGDPCKKLHDYTADKSPIPKDCPTGTLQKNSYRISMYFRAWNLFCDESTITVLRLHKRNVSPESNVKHRSDSGALLESIKVV